MACVTITITDTTQPAQNLLTLLQKGSAPGYTVQSSGQGSLGASLSTIGEVSYLSIQSSPRNSNTVYKGDENVKNNGTWQGKEMQPGDVDVQQGYPRAIYLGEVFLAAAANGAIINVEYHLS